MLKRILAIFLGLMLLAAVWQRQTIVDYFVLAQYQPTPEITAFTERMSFTERGTHVFYASQPEIDDKAIFNEHCPIQEDAAVLGCYATARIYVLRVTEPELAGVMDVTAAHEMLHAAYARLGSRERAEIDQLLEAEFRKVDRQALHDIIELYERSDPSQRLDEIHSRLGTEIADLNPELELYYQRYFSNRQVIVATHQSYEEVFNQIKRQQDSLESQIEALKQNIESKEQQAEILAAELEDGHAEIERLRGQGKNEEANQLVDPYNARVSRYNGLIAEVRRLIADHNALVNQFNSLNIRQKELRDSIDSNQPDAL